MRISQHTALPGGTLHLPQGITIAANGVTLDGNGTTLVGGNSGNGVLLAGCNNVTITNLRVQNYTHGIRAENCEGLTLSGVTAASTAEMPPNTGFLDIFRRAEAAYGGGIILAGARDSTVQNCQLSHQMCGLLAYDCRGLTVRENTANYCSGFGFYLSGVSGSLYEANYADFCCRCARAGGGHMGADAAGFVIVRGSRGNTFRGNFARLGGDGFFLAGLTHNLEPLPCNDNLFEGNDASWSPNIAFEATFSRGNVFRNNTASHCNYGFWLGFSGGNILEGNAIHTNRTAGIAVENGVEMTARGNDLRGNSCGMLLWSKRIPQFDAAVPANDTSRDWLIEANRFTANACAIRIAADQDHGVRPYSPDGVCPPPHHHLLRENIFERNGTDVDAQESAIQ
jgi:parallel beta-helix repeat protein